MTFFDIVKQAIKEHGFIYYAYDEQELFVDGTQETEIRWLSVGPNEIVTVGVREDGYVTVGDDSTTIDCMSFNLHEPDSIQNLLDSLDECMEYECSECPKRYGKHR